MTCGKIVAFLALGCCAAAQTKHNYDESKVQPYTLPDPLTLLNGEPVRDAAMWSEWRRPEILHLFETYQFGRTPTGPYAVRMEVISSETGALNGLATRKQIVMHFSNNPAGPKANLLLYVPAKHRGPAPVFLGLNFNGNHSVAADAGIRLNEVWVQRAGQTAKQMPDPATRGSQAQQWQVEKILGRGYALATICYDDIEPDFDGGIKYGVRPLFFRPGQNQPAPDDWGAIGAWAWGLSRAVDYLETDPDIDAKKIALMGHSRLGKTALWAGAQDPRFAIVISNESGEGGASISRRNYGEDLRKLNTSFPHWFCANYRLYSGHEPLLPMDSHMLMDLIAPRPLYVASAEDDRESDPRGEFLAAFNAGVVYRLLGKRAIESDRMPALNHPVGDTVAYHIRAGKHDVTEYDWEQYLDFADRHFGGHP